jgi:hypothetical protein
VNLLATDEFELDVAQLVRVANQVNGGDPAAVAHESQGDAHSTSSSVPSGSGPIVCCRT